MEKQPTSKMCFACGRENPIGFHLHFFTDDFGHVHADYTPCEEHQGYPGVMHGGLVTALLDETIGRTAIANDVWCMTAKLEVRFKKPVQINQPIHVRGEMTRFAGRLIEGRGEIRSVPEGELLAEARGSYIRIPDDEIESYKSVLAWWRVED